MQYPSVRFFILCLTTLCSLASSVHCMEKVDLAGANAPRSLYGYWGIPLIEQLPPELKESIASYIVPQVGWWYSQALPHNCFVGSVCIDEQKNQVLTGDEKGRMRRFDLATFNEVSIADEVEQSVKVNVQRFAVRDRQDRLIRQEPLGELSNIVFNKSTSQLVRVFDQGIKISGTDLVKPINLPTYYGYECKKVFLHPNNQDILILLNQKMNLLHRGPQRKLLVWYSLSVKKTLHDVITDPIKLEYAGCAGDLHPSGALFALAEGRRLTALTLKDGKFVMQPVQWDNEGMLSAMQFSTCGNYLVSCRSNGCVEINTVNKNLDGLDAHACLMLNEGIAKDVQFAPCGSQFYVALDSMIHACSIDGQKLFKCHQGSIAKQIAVHSSGNMFVKSGANIQGNAVVVWKKIVRPSLEQVLLRSILKKHSIACAEQRVDTQTAHLTTDKLIPWMVERFNIKEDDLKSAWDSFPTPLQESIIKTLVQRGKFTQQIE